MRSLFLARSTSFRAALIGWGSGVLLAVLLTLMTPKRYESVAVLKLNLEGSHPFASSARSMPSLRTEAAQLTSEKHLSQVCDRLVLTERWSADRAAVVAELRERIEVEILDAGALLKVVVGASKAEDARDIAQEVGDVYVSDREAFYRDRVERTKESLVATYRSQETKVEALRIAAELLGSEADPATLRGALLHELELSKEVRKMEGMLKMLQKLKGDSRRTYAASLDHPENGVPFHMNELVLEKQEAAELQASGLGGGHPRVVRSVNRAQDLRTDLDEAVEELVMALEKNLEPLEKRWKAAEDEVAQQREDQPSEDFMAARQAYFEARDFLGKMKLDHDELRREMDAPRELVVPHLAPQLPTKYERPSWTVNLALGSGGGLLVGWVVALVLARLERKE